MRLSKYRPNQEISLELSTTSMIDVVFLLLIFFLVTTTFLTPERQLKPDIRVQEQASASATADIEPAMVEVVRQGGVAVYRLGMTVTSDAEMLSQVLEQYPDKTRGAIVRLSDDCPFGMAATAIARCRRAGFQNVSLVPRP
jgi:biopolymer transport protein ExbD